MPETIRVAWNALPSGVRHSGLAVQFGGVHAERDLVDRALRGQILADHPAELGAEERLELRSDLRVDAEGIEPKENVALRLGPRAPAQGEGHGSAKREPQPVGARTRSISARAYQPCREPHAVPGDLKIFLGGKHTNRQGTEDREPLRHVFANALRVLADAAREDDEVDAAQHRRIARDGFCDRGAERVDGKPCGVIIARLELAHVFLVRESLQAAFVIEHALEGVGVQALA